MDDSPRIAVIGSGPAGLYAAEVLAGMGARVTVYDRMPSPARKFLMAGRGGLNLTHSEDLPAFLSRYRDPEGLIRRAVEAFPPAQLITWAHGLGVETFVGSSGRIFPKSMKASPLLRAWLRRLADLGVTLETGWEWRGFAGAPTQLVFSTREGPQAITADAVVLALGGGSWPRLGSDGAWVSLLQSAGVTVTPLEPSNCGVKIAWAEPMAKHFGAPLKRIALSCGGHIQKGEAVITKDGLEGGALYALSAPLRTALAAGAARLTLDLRPDLTAADLAAKIAAAPAKASWSTVLRKSAALSPAAIALVREAGPVARAPDELAARVKAIELPVAGLAGLERAISTAGGVSAGSLNDTLMLKALPGMFAAGEMLEFDAPTGGYLLQAAFATGHRAALGCAAYVGLAEVQPLQATPSPSRPGETRA